MATSAAQKYFDSFSPAQKTQIRASWGGQDRLQEWFDNGVRAGAVNADGTTPENPVGATEGHTDQSTADVTGMRAWAREHGMSEDFDRFDEPTLQRWASLRDEACPPKFPYRQDQGHSQGMPQGWYNAATCVEKPIDGGGVIQDEKGDWKAYTDPTTGKAGSQVGTKGDGGAPAEPVTHGELLSYTGDPMQDMLIYQFNTKATLDGQRKNLFGLGEDRAVGGEGENEDLQNVVGQTLAGGGLWWSGDESAFGGYGKPPEAQKKKRKPGGAPNPADIAAPPPDTPQPNTDAPGTGGPPNPDDILGNLPPNIPGYKRDQIEEMLMNGYSNNPGGQ